MAFHCATLFIFKLVGDLSFKDSNLALAVVQVRIWILSAARLRMTKSRSFWSSSACMQETVKSLFTNWSCKKST